MKKIFALLLALLMLVSDFLGREKALEVYREAVREKYRKTGLGMELVATMVACMRKKGVEKIFLEVRVSNMAALGLYTKNGFEKTRIRNRYYPDGEDAVEMLKVL